MLSFIGALLTAAAGAVLGENAAQGLLLKENQLGELAELLDKLEIYLTSYHLSTEELFSRIYEEKGSYAKLFCTSDPDITAEVSARVGTSGLELADRLSAYIKAFGSTDLEGQLAQNRLLRLEVGCALEKARDARSRFSKIYRIAGLSAGLTAALLLI